MPKKAIAFIEDIIFMNKQNIPKACKEQLQRMQKKAGIATIVILP